MRSLIVEDNPDLGLILKKELEKLAYAVDLVRNGEEGSFLARTNDYELIILDLVLPGINGHQILKEIRDDGKEAIIIAISFYDKIENRLNWLNLGADDYLAKPFTMAEFIARIKANTRRKNKPIVPKTISFADLKMNLANFEVWRNNKKIYLTKREFSLLKFFIFNSKQVMSRIVIMENVWDINGDPLSNTIETHIMRLRKKTEKQGKRLIHTVNGHGYKLDKVA